MSNQRQLAAVRCTCPACTGQSAAPKRYAEHFRELEDANAIGVPAPKRLADAMRRSETPPPAQPTLNRHGVPRARRLVDAIQAAALNTSKKLRPALRVVDAPPTEAPRTLSVPAPRRLADAMKGAER